MGNFSVFHEKTDDLAVVVAFDPGETTGWCAMGARAAWLDSSNPRSACIDLSASIRNLGHIEYGQIDCRQQGSRGWENTVTKHAGLMLWGENRGVTQMLDIINLFPRCAIVFEDFIPDNRFDKARHTLSPVRITSAFCYGLEQQGFSLDQLHVQNRSLAKTTCTDLRLKNWGLYDSHSGPHARDAVRHAYYFLRNCREPGIKGAENRFHAFPHLFHDPASNRNLPPSKPAKVGERIAGLG